MFYTHCGPLKRWIIYSNKRLSESINTKLHCTLWIYFDKYNILHHKMLPKSNFLTKQFFKYRKRGSTAIRNVDVTTYIQWGDIIRIRLLWRWRNGSMSRSQYIYISVQSNFPLSTHYIYIWRECFRQTHSIIVNCEQPNTQSLIRTFLFFSRIFSYLEWINLQYVIDNHVVWKYCDNQSLFFVLIFIRITWSFAIQLKNTIEKAECNERYNSM